MKVKKKVYFVARITVNIKDIRSNVVTASRRYVPLSSLPRPMSKQYDERVSCARNSGPIASESSPKTIRARTRARAVRKVSVCPGHATFSPRTRTHACTHTPSGRAGHCVTVTTLSFYVTSRAPRICRRQRWPSDRFPSIDFACSRILMKRRF